MRKYLPLIGVYFSLAVFVFSAHIASRLATLGVSPDVIKPLMAFLTITILTWSGKKLYDKVLDTDKVEEVSKDVKDIKDDNKLLHTSIAIVSDKVDSVAHEVNNINEYRDEKKRRYREFEQDWMGMRDNIRQLNNNDIYSFARLMKEAVKNTTMDFHSSGAVKLNHTQAIDILKEKYAAYKDEVIRDVQFYIPGEYLNYYFQRLAFGEKQMWKEICDTFENRVNRKDEGIQLVLRNFLRVTLNTLVVSWADWVSEHCDDEVLLERHMASEYYASYKSVTTPCNP